MLVSKNDAIKFAQKRAAIGATAETTRTMDDLSSKGHALPKQGKVSPDQIRGSADGLSRAIGEYEKSGDEAKLAAGLMGAAGNFLPSDVAKMLPYAQFALDGSWSKLLGGDKDTIGKALGMLTKFLPPQLAKLAGMAQPLLTKGLESLLGGKGSLPDLSSMMSIDGLMGLAGQFLPPWAGDALAIGKQLTNALPSTFEDFGNLAGSLDSMIGKFLPPELQAAWKALQDAGGLKGMIELFDKSKLESQGADGLWAARLGDLVVCNGGAGVIVMPCMPTVIIGGQPAARVTDIALCNGFPTDSIVKGEDSVLIGGLFAARMTDPSAHNGKIAIGFPTVHIGKDLSNTNLHTSEGCAKEAGAGGSGPGSAGAGAGAGGAATISGSGMTDPLSQGCFGSGEGLGLGDLGKGLLDSPLGEMAKNKLVDFASQKAGDLVGKVIGADKSKVYDGSNFQNPNSQKAVEKHKTNKLKHEDIPSSQPKATDKKSLETTPNDVKDNVKKAHSNPIEKHKTNKLKNEDIPSPQPKLMDTKDLPPIPNETGRLVKKDSSKKDVAIERYKTEKLEFEDTPLPQPNFFDTTEFPPMPTETETGKLVDNEPTNKLPKLQPNIFDDED